MLSSSFSSPLAASSAPIVRASSPAQMAANLFSSERGFFIRASAVGNAGFDPLGLANSDTLPALRHAELKHGRLAMMATLGLIVQEAIHPILSSWTGTTNVLTDGLAPTFINGGLNKPECAPAIAFGAGVMMVSEMRDIRARQSLGLSFNEWKPDTVAGDIGFDPLGFTRNMPATERFELQEAEMLNGRLASECSGTVPAHTLGVLTHRRPPSRLPATGDRRFST